MKLSIAYLALFATCVHAGRPKLSISVQDGNFDGVDGLNPTLSWEGSSSNGDLDVSYGIESDVRPTSDLASLPKSVWGKVKTDVSGWGVSARADIDAQDLSAADVEVDADNSDADLAIRLTASAGSSGGSVKTVEATKGMDMDGARITINPRYNVADEQADIVLGYNNDATDVKLTASADSQEVVVSHKLENTGIKLTASADSQEVEIDHKIDNTGIKLTASVDNQELTLSQQLNDRDRVSPTLNSNGDISVEWERTLDDDSRLTATVKPNDSIDVEWNDGDWTANVNMPISGTDITGANVHVKRDLVF